MLIPEIAWHKGTNLHIILPNIHLFINASTGVIGNAVMHNSLKKLNYYYIYFLFLIFL